MRPSLVFRTMSMSRDSLQSKLETSFAARVDKILEAEIANNPSITEEQKVKVREQFSAAFSTLASSGLGAILSGSENDDPNEIKPEEVTETDLLELDEALASLTKKRKRLPGQIVNYVEKTLSHQADAAKLTGTNLTSDVDFLAEELAPTRDFRVKNPDLASETPRELIGEDGESLFVKVDALKERADRMAASAVIALKQINK